MGVGVSIAGKKEMTFQEVACCGPKLLSTLNIDNRVPSMLWVCSLMFSFDLLSNLNMFRIKYAKKKVVGHSCSWIAIFGNYTEATVLFP